MPADWGDLAGRLREDLLDAGYTLDAVLARLGEQGQAGLLRNSTVPAERVLGTERDAQADLLRLFPLQLEVPADRVGAILPLPELISAGVITVRGGQARAGVDIRPYGFADDQGEWAGWVASDPMPGLNYRTDPTPADYVLGVSPASTTLAQLTVRRPVGAALDLGTGCGVQSLHLLRHADRVLATDLNPRAVRLARLTLALNGLDAEVRPGDLYQPVSEERFDLIVTNPPYVMSPPRAATERLTYRESDRVGDGLVAAVVSGAPEMLRPGGRAQVLANWADTARLGWQDRLAGWVAGTGADLWVIERERLDVTDYIELWLTDAGLNGHPDWRRRYQEWLDYFERLGITGVGMGWIILTMAGRDDPVLRFEQWPWQVHQPVGPDLAAQSEADSWASWSDERLLATAWLLRADVRQHSTGLPGAADPTSIVLRQGSGLARALPVGQALGGLLGACDGELSLAAIIAALADLLACDREGLTADLLPAVRRAIAEQFLSASPST